MAGYSGVVASSVGATLTELRIEMDKRFGQEDAAHISDYHGNNIVSGAIANTFGAWVELSADVGATPIVLMQVSILRATTLAVARPIEFELGTGAAASEVAVARISYRINRSSDVGEVVTYVFQILTRIPANARLSARIRDDEANARTYTLHTHYKVGA